MKQTQHTGRVASTRQASGRLLRRGSLQRRRDRMGTSIVEAAIVLPVFLMFVFAIFEFGHAQMVSNGLKAAARAGARLGATEGISTDQADARVRDIISAVIDPSLVEVMIRDGSVFDSGSSTPSSGGQISDLPDIELNDAEPRQLFVLRASVAYNDVAVLPITWMKNISLSGQAVMRHE